MEFTLASVLFAKKSNVNSHKLIGIHRTAHIKFHCTFSSVLFFLVFALYMTRKCPEAGQE